MADETHEAGFDLDDILNNVKMTQNEVTIYLDPVAGERALELRDKIDSAKGDASQEVSGITDEPLEEQLKAELAKLDSSSVTFTLRALSSSEYTAVNKHVVAANKIDKRASEDEREALRQEREELFFVHLLSRSITSVKYNATGAETTHLSPEDVNKIRHKIVLFEWNKLKSGYLLAQGKTEALEAVMDDPTFRGAYANEG